MGKRIITVLLTAMAVLMLTGCNADKKAVSESAEGFLTALVNNDRETASQYATEEFMKSETMMLMDPQYLADSFYAAMNVKPDDLDETARAAVDEYVKNVVAKAYKSFEVQDIKIQESTAAVTAKITLGYDPDTSSKLPETTNDLIKEYQTEHYDELISIYTDEGESAMYRKLYNDLIPIVVGEMQKQLDSAEVSEEKTILTLEKIDKKWFVTNLEENRPGAGAAGATSEEAAAAASTAGSSEYASTGSTSTEYASEDITSSEYADEDGTEEESAEAGTTDGEISE